MPNRHGNNQAGLYIHIPFCLSKCGYCSFYSLALTRLMPDFVEALIGEMAFYKTVFPSFDTIYIGGGTPSLLSIRQVDKILTAVHRHFSIARSAEMTMEVNPGDISLEYLQLLRRLGINRLNIGIQSFDDQVLKFLGRRHTAKEALFAFDAARRAGFDNIGIDLIYGAAGHHITSWKQTIKEALSFLPEHLSCYQLSLDRDTPLYQQYHKDGLQLPPENEALDFFMTTSQLLTDAGYLHYEVSNFTRGDSLKSRHNMKYWQHSPYLGLGPAAHSFLDDRRWWNKADVQAYLSDISEGKKPLDKSETLVLEQLALEALFLGMRTKNGINLKQFKARYGSDLLIEKRPVIDELIKHKLLELNGDSLCPTLAGMAVADSLALI
ncbi:MAG: radical SAM family heme chaperone HemW [Deltaproteobacteria bacterium]